jgi:beta-ureidopropionase / N-carbamoyl-L-amino-acid hydrolase
MGEWFLTDFAAISQIGATPAGGVDRQAGTAEHGQARRWLVDWFERHGLRTVVDRAGNLFGSVEWVPGEPYVLAGSHLDSQPAAGRFDGAYGVLAAAHAALQLTRRVEAGTLAPVRNLAVVDWFNEEGARFSPSLMGSGVYCGKLDVDAVLAVTDAHGVTVGRALRKSGFAGTGTPPAAAAAVEIHIEQGRTLEDERCAIGVVTGNWTARKYRITVQGDQSHTGATHMADRRDALVGASRLVLAVRELTRCFAPGQLLASVGRFTVEPNSPVVVPARVLLDVDVRSPEPDVLDEAHEQLLAEISAINVDGEVRVNVESASLRPRIAYPADGVALAEAAISAEGVATRRMLTMAGHDSINLAGVVPTVMLFVPSADGISHNEAEFTADTDLLNGVTALTAVTARLLATDLAGDLGGT